MRGPDEKQDDMFSYISPDKRVPADHPLRKIRPLVDQVLKEMSPQFGKLYSEVGRPSIAPERLLRALLLQIFYSVRSDAALRRMEKSKAYGCLHRFVFSLAYMNGIHRRGLQVSQQFSGVGHSRRRTDSY